MIPERRRHPRFETSLSCQLVLADDEVYEAAINSLSVGGLQFVCDRVTALRIAPKGHASELGPDSVVRVRLPLHPNAPEMDWAELSTRVSMVRRLAQNSYCFHVEYSDIGDDALESLAVYLDGKKAGFRAH